MFAAALACEPSGSGGTTRRPGGGKVDPFDGITLQSLKIQLSGAGAASYGGPVSHPLSPIESAIGSALSGLPMQHEPALSKMARELARASPHHTNIPTGLVDAIMAWAGLVDPPPRVVVVELPADTAGCHRGPSAGCQGAIDSLVGEVEATLPTAGPLVYGVGVARLSGNRTRMIVAVVERALVLDPIPTSLGPGRSVSLKGRLVGGRTQPYLEVFDAQGRRLRTKTSVSVDGTFAAEVPCRAPRGAYQVEVLAEGSHGPEVAANFPLYCGLRAPTRLEVELEKLAPSVSAEQVALANLHYLNAERKRRGLPEVVWDERAADVAKAHSNDMLRNNFVGHRSPTTGDVNDRLSRANVAGTVYRENVARGYGPKGIHRSLMASPGHRVNILATDVTHVGIGVVIGAAETRVDGAPRPVFLTQNFFRKPGAGAPADRQMAPVVRNTVDRNRQAAGLRPVKWDPGLTDVATRLARIVARGKRLPSGWQDEVFEGGFQSVETNQVRSGNFSDLGEIPLWATPQLEVGIGIARTQVKGHDGFLMIVLVGTR